MIPPKQILFIGFLGSLLWGCMTADTYYRRANQLETGMPRKEALSLMRGNPSVLGFKGVPEVKVYEFKVCPARKKCRFERLVFSNGRYVGKGLDPEEILIQEKIRVDMSRNELALLGAVPDTIRFSPPGIPPQELWAYRYLEGGVQERRLMVILKNGQVYNWLKVEKGRLPPEPPEEIGGGAAWGYFEALKILGSFF